MFLSYGKNQLTGFYIGGTQIITLIVNLLKSLVALLKIPVALSEDFFTYLQLDLFQKRNRSEMFLEVGILQISENYQVPWEISQSVIKKCFLGNSLEFLRIHIFENTSGSLLLYLRRVDKLTICI